MRFFIAHSPCNETHIACRIAFYSKIIFDHGNDVICFEDLKPFLTSLSKNSTIASPEAQLSAKTLIKNGTFIRRRYENIDADTVLCLDKDIYEKFRFFSSKQPTLVDIKSDQYESSKIHYFLSNHIFPSKDIFSDAKEKLLQSLQNIKSDTYHLVCTGPSIDNFKFKRESMEGKVMVANSAIVNHDLMETLKPDVIVCSDPIFHASFSQYAGDFRSTLSKVIKHYGSVCFVPFRDYLIYISYLPKEVHHKIIPVWFGDIIPQEEDKLANAHLLYNYIDTLTIQTTSNVLSSFMLQIGSTISNNLLLYGCDGRDPYDDSYYWSHGKTVQLSDKMSNIKECHPSFFDVDYNQYYRKHIQQLRYVVHALRNTGNKISIRTPTHIPSLRPYLENFAYISNSVDLSVVIPAYNCEKFISHAIKSINLCSSYNYEIIVIDDGSFDNTAKIVKNIARENSKVLYFKKRNSGVSAARNFGMEKAKGRYIIFLDADDFFTGSGLNSLLEKAITDSCNVTVGKTQIILENGIHFGHSFPKDSKLKLSYENIVENYSISTPATLMNTCIAREFSFDINLKNGEDAKYFISILRAGFKFNIINNTVVNYRWNFNSNTGNDLLTHTVGLIKVLIDTTKTSNSPLVSEKYLEKTKNINYAPYFISALFCFLVKNHDKVTEEKFLYEISALIPLIDIKEKPINYKNIFTKCFVRIFGHNEKKQGFHTLSKKKNQKIAHLLENCPSHFKNKFIENYFEWSRENDFCFSEDIIDVKEKPLKLLVKEEMKGRKHYKVDINVYAGINSIFKKNSSSYTKTFPNIAYYMSPIVVMKEHKCWKVDYQNNDRKPIVSERFPLINGWNRISLVVKNKQCTVCINNKSFTFKTQKNIPLPDSLTVGGGFLERNLFGKYIINITSLTGYNYIHSLYKMLLKKIVRKK